MVENMFTLLLKIIPIVTTLIDVVSFFIKVEPKQANLNKIANGVDKIKRLKRFIGK